MNNIENYKEIEEFAKSINLDVKFLLGEFYEGSLYLYSLQTIPENIVFNVGGSLWLDSLKTLPENISFNVGGCLNLYSLETLPENISFNVGGSINLYSLKTLPENISFNVGGNLYLNSLKTLSNNYKITLKGNLYIVGEEIFSKIVYKKINEDSIMYFENDFILVDGIYCKVIKNHENIKKCRKIGSTKDFYIVSSNGKHSHGETIEEAKVDLIYKISNRDKSVYKNLTKNSILSFEEAVECYRVITGACFFGTKNFIETFKVPIKDYSINEIIKLTENQYGGTSFKEFFK